MESMHKKRARSDLFALSELGPISHYNGLIFDSIEALQAETEGALAIGGDARFGSGTNGYDIGSAGIPGGDDIFIGTYSNPHGYPSLLLSGNVSPDSTSANVFTGDVVMSLANQANYEENDFRFGTANVSFIDDTIIKSFFANAKAEAARTSNILPQGSLQTISLSDLRRMDLLDLTKYENQNLITNKKILIFNIESYAGEAIEIGELFLSDAVLDYDMVVINSTSPEITFAGGAVIFNGSIVNIVPRAYVGNELVQRISSKFIFNFPNADAVNMLTYGLLGSVLAPNALLTGTGGSPNGMLIADGLLQQSGMELHAFEIPLGDDIFALRIASGLGSVEIIKVDSMDDNIKLAGAVFTIYKQNEETGQFELLFSGLTTDEDGTLIISDLDPGTYKLVETQAPPGYRLPEDFERIFTIDGEGEMPEVEIIYIENELAKGSIAFIKVDSQNQDITLAGAVFALYRLNVGTGEYELIQAGLITGANGTLIISDLLPGSYKLVETQAPPGYYLDPNNNTTFFTVTLDENGEVIEEQPIYIGNTLLGSIQIIKVDADNSDIRLEGAVFDLYKLNSVSGQYDLIQTDLVSGPDGSIILQDLEPGEYKLVETQAPAGYRLPQNPEFFFTISL